MKFMYLLTLIFISAKLFNQIDWNWFFVLSPIFIHFISAIIKAFFYDWMVEQTFKERMGIK